MVDLDSNPTKLIEIVEIGKQMLMTRGSLTTFCIANDVAKYFAIIPAAFATTYPQLDALNVMHLASPSSAILSAVIFNALIIVFLIPLALKGVKYRPRRRGRAAAPQPADLRPRRPDRAVRRHQADRPDAGRLRISPEERSHQGHAMTAIIRPALVLFAALIARHRRRLSAASSPASRRSRSRPGRRQPDRRDGKVGRLAADRPALQRPEVLLGPASATAPLPEQRRRLRRLEPGPAEPGADRCGQGPHRRAAAADPGNTAPVPVDLVTASASGLDPDISVAAARYQAGRVARARGLPASAVQALIARSTRRARLSASSASRASTCSS